MPTAVSILQRLHHHRAWANEKLVEAAATLSADQLGQPFDIGQGSVWRSLLHMYAAEYLAFVPPFMTRQRAYYSPQRHGEHGEYKHAPLCPRCLCG